MSAEYTQTGHPLEAVLEVVDAIDKKKTPEAVSVMPAPSAAAFQQSENRAPKLQIRESGGHVQHTYNTCEWQMAFVRTFSKMTKL